MLIKIYRLLSNKGLSKFIPNKILLKIQKLSLISNKSTVKIKLNNKKRFISKDYSNDFIFKKKIIEPETTKLFIEISKNYDLFVDVGACFGYYTLLSEAKNNIAIEPNKLNFSILEETIIKNNMKNTTLFNCAIGNTCGKRMFYNTIGPQSHCLRKEILEAEKREIRKEEIVIIKTLDELLKPFFDQKILFKIDIEGLEAEAFEGMKNLFLTNNIDIIFEYNKFRYTQEDFKIVHKIVKNFDILYLGITKNITKKITFDELLEIENDDCCNLFLRKRG